MLLILVSSQYGADVSLRSVWHSEVPSQTLSLLPRDKSDAVWSLAVASEKADWLFRCRYLDASHFSTYDIIDSVVS